MMTKNVRTITGLLGLALLAGGCEAQKSENPLSPNVAGPIAGVSISVPAPVSPSAGSEVLNTSPVRLTFANSSTNGVRPLWYVVELASDSSFNSKVYTNGRVMPAEGTQTIVTVETHLPTEATYFWRVKADDGANASQFSNAAHFDLVVPVSIAAPTPVSPSGGQTTTTRTPTLSVTNGGVTGRAGHVDYKFEVATDQAFSNVVRTLTAGRSNTGTTSVQTNELAANTVFFWRAWGTNGQHHSPLSGTQSFRTPAAPTPGPGPGPAPAPAPPASNVTPENMPSYLASFSQGHPEWTACQAGSGTACFRFVWAVAQSVNPTCNANSWGVLSKNPGEWQCTRAGCGSLGGEGFGEDIITYGSSPVRLWDIIVGAGAPGASLGYSEISNTRRAGNNWACPWR